MLATATATAVRPYTRSAGTDHSVWFADGSLTTFLATGEDTDGAFALVEMVAPKGAEAPPHIHTAETECFYIVEGRVAFDLDGRRVEATRGTWAVVPANTPHSFRVESDGATMLVFLSRAGFERFFMELSVPVTTMGEPAPEQPLDVPRLVATAEKYGCHFLPPAS